MSDRLSLRSGALRLLLASSSAAALLIGAGTPPALAAGVCAVTQAGGPPVASVSNSAAINCINVVNNNVAGDVINTSTGVLTANGTFRPPTQTGITVNNSSIGGSVSNAGVIGATVRGILVEGDAFVSGGITNSGTITHIGGGPTGLGIQVAATILGGISNAGTISIGSFGYGIRVSSVSQIGSGSSAGGITNSGTITAGSGIRTFNSTFAANISNSGVIVATEAGIRIDPMYGVDVGNTGNTFAGGVANSGTITGGGYGILVGFNNAGIAAVASFGGGISNTSGGVISAANGIVVGGMAIGNTFPTSLTIGTFASGITNAGTVTATAGAGVQVGGIALSNATITVSAFSGGITSSGAITQSGGAVINSATIGAGILVGGFAKGLFGTSLTAVTVSTFAGGIANTGTITANNTGIWVGGVTTRANTQINIGSFTGGISNGGTITANDAGILVGGIGNVTIGSFANGISNSGTIAATGFLSPAIAVGAFQGNSTAGISTFTGGITNSGLLTGIGIAIELENVGSFGGGIVNAASGSISGMILIGADFAIASGSVSRFSGDISNAGTISSGSSAIRINSVSTFAGNVVNSGTISSSGSGAAVQIGNVASFLGGVTNSGTITGGDNFGIVVGGIAQVNSQSFTIGTLSGGITNAGAVSLANAIVVGGIATSNTKVNVSVAISAFSGGITNTGTLAGAGTGVLVGGLVDGGSHHITIDISTFAGGISNGGTISMGTGVQVGGLLHGSATSITIATFAGGITNSSAITAVKAGILVGGAATAAASSVVISTFAGGISNAGTITVASGPGIHIGATAADSAVSISTFAGGITNTGTIASLAANAIAIQIDHVGSFSGDILNAAGGSIAGSVIVGTNLGPGISLFTGNVTNAGIISTTQSTAILVNGVTTFVGNVVNKGTLTGASESAVRVENVATFTGAVVNSGTITLSGGGMFVTSVGVFGTTSAGGGMVNSGLVSVTGVGMRAENDATFLGGMTNAGAGVITARTGILVSAVATLADGISNAGQIAAANTGIRVGAGVGFAAGSHIVNTGTITGGVAAIDVAQATSAVTIDQVGGAINGAINLSSAGNADFLNVFGGTINGNVTAAGNAGTVNFILGSGSFTYAAAMTGLEFVNFNSGTVFVDGSIHANFIDVNSGGTAGGIGTLAGAVLVTSGGTLMPGNPANQLGTLHITGSLTVNAGSFYAVNIAPGAGNNSSTAVTGNAAITGGTVVVTPRAGQYNATDYVIVSTTGGRSGTFAGLTVNGFFTGSMTLDYTTIPGDVLLDVSAGIAGLGPLTAPPGLSIKQQNVLNAINNAILSGQTPPPGFLNLFNLSGPQLAAALTQLSGENSAGFFQGAFQAGNSFLGLMVNPFLDGRFGSGGGFGAAMGFAADEPPALPQAALAFASAMPVKAAPAPASFEQRFSVWSAAYGGSGRVLGDPVLGSHDNSASTAAFAAGIDYRLSRDTLVGFALAGGGTSWNVTAGLGGGSSDMFQAGVYASHHWGAAYLSGAIAYNFHDVTTNRTLTIAGTDMLQARFQTNGVGVRLEGGYRYATPWLGITPYAAAQVQSIALPNYGETATAGSNQFALNFASQTATTTRTEFGAWLDRGTRMDSGALLTLYGRAAWAHDFGNSPSASAIFQALPGSNFIVNGAVPARDGALVTGAAQYSLASGWAFLAKFDGEFSSTTSVYSGSGMVKRTW